MLTRRGSGFEITRTGSPVLPRIVRVSSDTARPIPLRAREAYLARSDDLPPGFGWYLRVGEAGAIDATRIPPNSAVLSLPASFAYLGDGDVLRITDTGAISVLFQRSARHNSFLLTERCNNYCLMCSQPPRDVSDGWIVDDIMAAIPLVHIDTPEIGFTGGEPTLLGERLVELVRQCKSYLPHTGLHVLSNGRAFADKEFARAFAEVRHHDLMFGIPVYSDLSEVHNYVVQADGAFDETIRGILNLKQYGVMVEIRVVIHKQTYSRLADLARYIARNLTFVDQVVFMGLEMTGFTKANLEDLWIDPIDYQPELVEAVRYLDNSRIKASVYNHQLCITDRRLWRFAQRSISDWKNEYMPECDGCSVRARCAGFFSSARLRYSSHIQPLREEAVA
jgi:His-Xaa-Ser system radical SAM maturase HxsC